MKKIYAPWRNDYVTNVTHKTDKTALKNECVFCHQFEENKDEKNLILKRLPHCAIMMNHYPYNGGHLMVLPLEHIGTLEDLTPEVRTELMEATSLCTTILNKVLKPHGCNIGINLGKAGGGGIPSHLHIHILPRWAGDTNFLPLLADTKPLSVDLEEIYKKLKKEF